MFKNCIRQKKNKVDKKCDFATENKRKTTNHRQYQNTNKCTDNRPTSWECTSSGKAITNFWRREIRVRSILAYWSGLIIKFLSQHLWICLLLKISDFWYGSTIVGRLFRHGSINPQFVFWNPSNWRREVLIIETSKSKMATWVWGSDYQLTSQRYLSSACSQETFFILFYMTAKIEAFPAAWIPISDPTSGEQNVEIVSVKHRYHDHVRTRFWSETEP